MNWKNIATIYLKELKDALRDRRTLISTIVIPTIVMPLLTFSLVKIGASVTNKARQEIPSVMVLGGEDSPGVVAQLKESAKMRVVPSADDWKDRISEKKLRAAVRIPAGFEAGLNSGKAEPVMIYHYSGEMKSKFGVDELETFFRELREKNVAARLTENGLPPTLSRLFETKRENVAPPEKVAGATLGGLVPYIIILLCYTGAMYPGIDLTAGEKERGTMETLLCSPASRVDIVLGKFLLVLTGSLSAMAFSLISMSVSAVVIAMSVGGNAGRAAATATAKAAPAIPMIDPAGLLGVLAMVLPIAVFFSAVILSVALFAKSYKEAQSYVGPLIFIIIMPAALGMMPGIDLNLRLAFVPILSLSLVCKEMLSGVWHWDYIAVIFGSSCVYAAIALAAAVKMFNRESVIFRT